MALIRNNLEERQKGKKYSEQTVSMDQTNSGNDTLEHYGHWLMSISRDEVRCLRETPEFATFVQSFEQLGHAHRETVRRIQNRAWMKEVHVGDGPDYGIANANYSFLQHLTVDDIVLRVLEFLNCSALIQISQTCHRFHGLALKSAHQRTQGVTHSHLLESVMKLLRSKEHMEGICPNDGPFVQVPLLGLPQRVCVNGAGDEDYNGIYFCTGTNSNGFMFTKPCVLKWGHHRSGGVGGRSSLGRVVGRRNDNSNLNRDVSIGINRPLIVNHNREDTYHGRVLRCVIAKRFSNETILWYMYKEIKHENGDVNQIYSFWTKLLFDGDALPEMCDYPSQTSVLSHAGNPAWQPLSHIWLTNPPTVELMN